MPPIGSAAPPPLDPTPVPIALEESEPIPEQVPKDQIRRVGLLCHPSKKGMLQDFVKFLDPFTRKALKKPIYLRRVLVEEISERSDAKAILERARQAGAVGLLAVVSGLTEARMREFEQEFAQGGLFYQEVPPGEALKGSFALDISMALSLLQPET